MTRWQQVRIALLLVVIFAGGFVAGRLSVPQPPTRFLALSGEWRSTDEVLARMAARFNLDTAQQRQFRPILEAMARRMAALPPHAPERLAVFRECAGQLRPLLRPEQLPAFERSVEQSLRTYERRGIPLPGRNPDFRSPEGAGPAVRANR
jgi:hypothetical protein